MYKTAVKWEPDYWQDEGLPSSGCFGFVNGHLILGKGHHQLIMARLISAGWTWEQLMEAEQAWGWYNLEPVSYHEQYFDIENMKDWQKHSYFVHVMFTSDAGYQNEDAKNGALGAFASMYHIPAKEDKSYGSYGVDKNVNKEYGSGLKGLQNADKYLKDPKHYFQNQKKLFQNVPQPPGSEWDPEWEEKLKNVTNPDVEEVEQEQKQYMPEPEKHVIPSTVPPAVEEWYPSLEKQHGENPLNGIYFTSGSNWLLYTNGYATWYNNNGNVETPTSPVSHETMQGWINSMKIDKVGPKTFGGYEGVYVNSQHPDTSNHLHIDSDSATWKHPTTGDVVGSSVLDPASIKNHIDQGKLIKAPGSISVGDKFIYNDDANKENPKIYEVSEVTPNDVTIVWPEMISEDGVSYDTEKFKDYFTKVSYTPGGKTKGWGDIMEKANYIRGNGGVQITSNEPQHVTGTVQSGTDPGNKGPYHTEIWRDDPQSQAITMWDCDCDWDQYAWGRTRQWKKYEGRPCCHVLALYWDALQNPPAGGGAQPAAPPTPTPGGGVTVNQGLIAPVGQPPMNVPLIGPEEAPAPMGPEEAPQPAWSEVVQPGKEEGTITFPGTFSHWKEASDYEVESAGYVKYPRTYHLPWSPGPSSDDKVLESTGQFVGKEVVITEKMDGENTTMYQGYIHARSLESGYHPTRTMVKALHGQISHQIPEGWRIVGENMQGQHSIAYNLSSPFYVFAVFDENNTCLSWDDTQQIAEMLGLPTVPVLWRGQWDESAIQSLEYSPTHSDVSEGYVVRNAAAFSFTDFEDNVAKFVRENHIQTDEHWMENPQFNAFSHWKESKVNIPDDSREELENFWHEHPDLRAECKKKYGYDPVDEADGYWPHGLGDEPEHHVIWDAVKDGDEFTIGLVKKWEKQELAAAKKESSAPTEPPNYRKANKSNEKCGTCKMFFKGKCWGYGNKPVEKNMVCDSFTPDTKTSGWLEELRAMPNSFKNGDIVRVWEDTEGYAQAAYGQPDYPTMITRNMSGEVLSSNPETTIAIFPLKTGPLEHHLVRVEAPTSNFYLDNTNAQPFVKKKQSNLVSTPPSNN